MSIGGEPGVRSAAAVSCVVIGTSAGGLEALRVIVGGLAPDLPAAVLIVMHISPQGPGLLSDLLSRVGPLRVGKSTDGELIEHGKLYIAPPDHHLLVKGQHISLSRGPKENCSRPAIDPLFRTAAAAFGARTVGIILTGMLDDGTAGLAAVKGRGGATIIQDPREALYPSMPESALRYVGGDFVLPIGEIAASINRLVREPRNVGQELPASLQIEIETRFVEMETMSIKDMEAIGTHAGVSCPECHGPIWKIKDGPIQRYRCHVGHAYSAQTMLAGQIEAQETHLWQALRVMKERVALIWEMRAHAQDDDRAADARAYEATVRRLERNIGLIQDMLEEGELSG